MRVVTLSRDSDTKSPVNPLFLKRLYLPTEMPSIEPLMKSLNPSMFSYPLEPASILSLPVMMFSLGENLVTMLADERS